MATSGGHGSATRRRPGKVAPRGVLLPGGLTMAERRRRITPAHAPIRVPRRAFSLVELLVAIGIIGLLLALLLPVIGSVRRAANATKCLANVHQWAQAYQMYLSANRGRSF